MRQAHRLIIEAIAVLLLFLTSLPAGKAATEVETVAAQLQRVYDANKNSQDREVVAASTLLSTLIAALLDHRALELSDYVRPFSQMELDRLQEELKRRRGL
jgi:hypothetical protein